MSPQEDRDTFEFAVNEFLGDLNPAVEGRRWLVATHLDKVVMQRAPVKVELEGHVSVNLRTCRATLQQSTPKFAMVQAVESAFNTLGQMTKTPLIVDSGASCCISPHREDFVTYHDSKVKIKDLSGVNKVSGEGMVGNILSPSKGIIFPGLQYVSSAPNIFTSNVKVVLVTRMAISMLFDFRTVPFFRLPTAQPTFLF
jgi:hypothetical protein